MKFIYEFRTRDNTRKSGVICAASREAAFSALREQGIKPSFVSEAPGFFNKLFGKYKRWITICILLVIVGVLSCILLTSEDSSVSPDDISYATSEGFANPIERRQIWGDNAVIEQASLTHWRMVFINPAERMLALFAQPGLLPKVFPAIPESIHQDFTNALSSAIKIDATDLDEYKQMKCIVAGMKNEMKEYLSSGGTIDSYLKRLVMRQKEELSVWEQAQSELTNRIEKGEDAVTVWQEINRLLREQGLQTIPFPNNFQIGEKENE